MAATQVIVRPIQEIGPAARPSPPAAPGDQSLGPPRAPICVVAGWGAQPGRLARLLFAHGLTPYAVSDVPPGEAPDLVLAVGVSALEIASIAGQFPGARAWLLLGTEPEPTPLPAKWVYSCSSELDDASILDLIDSALGRVAFHAPVRKPLDRDEAEVARDALDAVRDLSVLTDTLSMAHGLVRATLSLGAADRAWCWFHDNEAATLYDGSEPDSPELPADRGLIALATRTCAPVIALQAGAHPEFGGAPDRATLGPQDCVLCQPVLAPDGVCHAVLVAVRAFGRDPFSGRERETLATLAHYAGSALGQLAMRGQIDALMEVDGPFRRAAFEAHEHEGERGAVVRISPRWVAHAYPALLVLVGVAVAFLFVGKIHQYSPGPAVVRAENRVDVVGKAAGTIESVDVSPGDGVEQGQVIARLYDRREAKSVLDLEQQWETQLRHYLLEPASESVRQILASLRAQRRTASAELEERLIRAPRAGVIGEIHTRVGAALGPGEVVASIVQSQSRFGVVAFIPASDAPQIRVGMPLRLEITGYPYAYLELKVARFAKEATGAKVVGRLIGQRLEDAIDPGPSTVLVEADLPGDHFQVDGRRYPFREGMPARAEIRLRSEPIAVALLPWLRRLQ